MTTQAPATSAGPARGRAVDVHPPETASAVAGDARRPQVALPSPLRAPGVDAGTAAAALVTAVAGVFAVARVAGLTWATSADGPILVAAVTGVAAAGLCLAAGRTVGRSDLRSAWMLVGIALVAWTASIVLGWAARAGPLEATLTASVARLVYLAFFPVATIGILRLSGHPRRGSGRALALDAASVCIAVVAALYILAAPWGARPAPVVPEVAFRAGDAIVAVALVLTALRWPVGAPRLPMIALGAGFALLLVTDLAWSVSGASGRAPAAPPAEALAALAMSLAAWGAAAQIRSGPIAVPELAGDEPSHGLVPLLPGVAVTAALAALLTTRGELLDAPVTVLLIGATALTVVAGVRRVLGPNDAAIAERALRAAEARLRAALDQGSDVVVTVDRAGIVRTATAGLARLTDYAAAETIGSPFTDRVDAADRKRIAWDLGADARWRRSEPRVLEFRMLRRDFTPVHVEATLVDLGDDPATGGTIITLRDVAERRLYETDLRRQAFHDQLTGLANRGHFFDRVEHALERCLRNGDRISVLYMDLDGFKRINDSLGHAFGDRVLAVVGERLSWSVRGGDMAARLGGDEFAVLLEEQATPQAALAIAERIQSAVATPIGVDGRQVRVGVSIGIASSETLGEAGATVTLEPLASGVLADELVRNADVAMYEAKHGGKDRVAAYEPAMRQATVLRLDTETALREAVDERQFVVHYQPIVDLTSGRIVAMEALARWRRPGVGLVSPSSFIAIAEETGLVRAMGAQLLRTSCETAAGWSGTGPFDLTVNLSPRQIQDPLLVGIVERALIESGLDPRRLVFEITESLLLDDGALTIGRLDQLRAMGIRLAIDDFGTGYSSLSYLEQLPVDILKIDRAFVVGLATAPRRAALLRAIVAMAGAFGLTTVAEGVETARQLALVRQLGCDSAQGFFLAGPTGAEQATALLAQDAASGGSFADLLHAIPTSAARGDGGGRVASRRPR